VQEGESGKDLGGGAKIVGARNHRVIL
jgi:hypothetical protein